MTPTVPSKHAQELDRKVLAIKAEIRRNWLEMGRALAEILVTLAYRELGFPNSGPA